MGNNSVALAASCITIGILASGTAVLVGFSSSSSRANAVQYRHPVVFDDFHYASSRVGRAGSVFGSNEWSDRRGNVVDTSRCWYVTNWSDHASGPSTITEVRLTAPNGALHLDARAGHETVWAPGQLPPMVAAGFTSQRGVWAARLRFADISREVQMMQSFWTMTPYTVCEKSTCERATNHWSEFDHEWNNWFDRRLRPQMMSTGGIIDGEEHTVARYAHYMRSPPHDNTKPMSCLLLSERGTPIETLTPSACRGWFTRGWVDLMIHVGSRSATFEAVAWASFSDAPTGEHILMRRTIELPPGEPQAMFPVFSQLLAPNRRLRQDQGFSVDWFYFTPDYASVTNLKALQLDVVALREAGLVRVNTTGWSLNAPTEAEKRGWADLDVHRLEGPRVLRDRYVWTAFPTPNGSAYYHLDWSSRTREDVSNGWSNWTPFSRSGLLFSLPVRPSNPPAAIEIRTRLQYVAIYGQPTESVVRCFGYRPERVESYNCD